MSALFRGFGPAMLRAFPANAATFVSLLLSSCWHVARADRSPSSQLGVELSLQAMNKLF